MRNSAIGAALSTFLLLGSHCDAQESAGTKCVLLYDICLSGPIGRREPVSGIDSNVNEINLLPVGHVTIYQGIGLSELVTSVTKEKSFGSNKDHADVYVGSSPNGVYFDVHYERAGRWGVVQIFGYINSSPSAAAAGNFISRIQNCAPNDSKNCTRSLPLSDAGKYVATLK
jgi:hypothetical protein